MYFPFVHDHGAQRRRSGFRLSKEFITYTTTGPRGDGVGFICRLGFIYFKVHDHGAQRRRSGFHLSKDFITYTTTGPRGDGVGFNCRRT